jgi:tetratricopeptide (TPR) repeat protein
LAQYYVDIGDLKNAEESLQKMLLLKTKYPEIELSPRLYYLVNSKIYLNNGQYEFALKEIEYCLGIEENKIILNNTFLYGTYLLQARILNRMKNYNKAKEICLKIYKQSTFTKLDSDLIALTYIELSTAELGLNSINNDAFNYAEQAYKLLKNNKIRNNDILHSRDTYLADAIVAKSNALSSVGKPQQAIEGYLVAEVIYYNKYKNNMKNIDDISYMYYNAALAGKNMKTNSIWFTQFHNKHLKYFGQNHQRSKELD